MNTDQAAENQQTFSDEELAESANFGPAFDMKQVSEFDQAANDNTRGLQRRLALLTFTKSADELADFSASEPEAFKEMLDSIEAFKEHAQALAEFAEAAYFRMLLAGCRQEAAIQ